MLSKHSARLAVEQLDERALPAVHSLAAPGAELATSGFIARQSVTPPAAVEGLDTFVRIQGDAGRAQQGYNTNDRSLQFDERPGRQNTHALRLGQVPVVVVNGVAYREFILDINQKASSPRLSLDEVRVFLGNRGDLDRYNQRTDTLAGARSVFNLDAGGNVSLVLDSRLGRGGWGDMVLLIPDANFAGAAPDTFVYLYSEMGGVRGATSNGGFESWAVRPAVAPPPTTPSGGATASLSGFAFVDFNYDGVPDGTSNAPFDERLAGVVVRLTGTDDLGNAVDLVTTTDENGAYSFANLRAGAYTLSAAQPDDPNLADGPEYLGGVAVEGGANDQLAVALTDGQQAAGYNFSEYWME